MTIRLRILLLVLTLGLLPALPAVAADLPDPRRLSYPPLQFSIPATQRAVLKNGLVVHLLEDHELPLVSITAYLDSGEVYVPTEKVGLGGLTGAVLRSGGTSRTPVEALDAELEFMASAVEAGVGSDSGTVGMTTLSRNLDRTLALFAQVITEPAFREDRLELARRQALEALRRQNDDPKGVADRELAKLLYAGHPLGRVPTPESLRAISRDDLVAFHRRTFRPNGTILAVAGDFRKEELLAKLEQAFAAWQPTPRELPAVAPSPATPRPGYYLVTKELNQSVIRMGHPGIDKRNPDLHALKVLDYILGGGFTSRLMSEVRSNQGLAYHVGAGFDVGRRYAGLFHAETETRADATAKAIQLMRGIIAGMTTAPVTPAELALAKESLVNSFIFGFAKPDAVVNQRARLEFFDYPAGYLEGYRDGIARVDAEQLLAAARRWLRPADLAVLVVGDPQRFDRPLTELGPVQAVTLPAVEPAPGKGMGSRP